MTTEREGAPQSSPLAGGRVSALCFFTTGWPPGWFTHGTRDSRGPPRGDRARLLRLRRRADASVVAVRRGARRVVCVCTRVYARVHKTCVSAVVPRGGVNRVCVELSWLRQSRATTGTAATGTGAARSPTRRIRGAPCGGGVVEVEERTLLVKRQQRCALRSPVGEPLTPRRAAPSLQQATPPSDTELSRASLSRTRSHSLSLSLFASLLLSRVLPRSVSRVSEKRVGLGRRRKLATTCRWVSRECFEDPSTRRGRALAFPRNVR